MKLDKNLTLKLNSVSKFFYYLFNKRLNTKCATYQFSNYLLLLTLVNCLFLCVESKANILNNFTNNNIDNLSYNLVNNQSNLSFIPDIELINKQSNFHCNCPPKGQNSKSVSVLLKRKCFVFLNYTVSYSCLYGYTKVNGSEKLTCILKDNKTEWDNEPLNCKIIICKDPGEVENATRKIKLSKDSISKELTYKSQIDYKCNNGYTSDAPPFITCGRNGQWNRKIPKCRLIQCPHVIASDNRLFLQYSNPERLINSTVKFQCSMGYHIDDVKNLFRKCQHDGSWSGSNPKCLPNYCKLPDDLSSNVQITPRKDIYYPNNTFYYECPSRKDKVLVKCMQDGSFRGLPNECLLPKKTHCPLVEIQHGQVNSSAQDKFIIGSKLSFKCDENYILSEDKLIHCQHNGEWTNKPPRCIDLSNLENSQMLTLILTCTFVILILVVIITIIIVFRWRQKQVQRRKWQRYFYNYEYQHDKSYMRANSSQEMKLFFQKKLPVPFTDL